MSKRVVYLTDEQWKKIAPLIPKAPPRPKGGRPRADDRLVFEGILWVLKTGARWKDLPDRYPHPSTCWRRLRQWYETDVLKDMWRAFLSQLDHNGILDWDEVFVDASLVPAKKGARESGLPSGERDRSVWYWSMARVFLSEALPTLGSLQTTIYRGAHSRLDYVLPAHRCQIRESYQHVRGLLPGGLHHGNVEEMPMKFCNRF